MFFGLSFKQEARKACILFVRRYQIPSKCNWISSQYRLNMGGRSRHEPLDSEWKEIIFENIRDLTKNSKFLTPSEHSYYCASFPGFRARITETAKKIHDILIQVLEMGSGLTKVAAKDDKSFQERFGDVIEDYDPVIDLVDGLLEYSAEIMDHANNPNMRNKRYQSLDAPLSTKYNPRDKSVMSNGDHFEYSENIPRPQLKFEGKIDNTNRPFLIKLTEKKNAMVPLSHEFQSNDLRKSLEAHISTISSYDDTYANLIIKNPYDYEISHIEYPERQLTTSQPTPPLPIEETPLHWIDKLEDLQRLSDTLDKLEYFSVDLEHHSYRTYLGFCCIIQISTRTDDYIIDALALRSHIQLLNSSFTNPKILKVFHGAEMDIRWLQRDFGVYVVNMFDTVQSARVLNLPHAKLGYILGKYCNVVTDKRYQLADWRTRPLMKEMIHYARVDTHYLLYIYEVMKNELIEASEGGIEKLDVVYTRSEEICKITFSKDIYDYKEGKGPGGWAAALNKIKPSLYPEQAFVFKELHRWRDETARQEDESPMFVIPSYILVMIARSMPSDVPSLLGLCNYMPPLIKQYAIDVVKIIADTREKFSLELLDALNSSNREPHNEEVSRVVDDTSGGIMGFSEFDCNSKKTESKDIESLNRITGRFGGHGPIVVAEPNSKLFPKDIPKHPENDNSEIIEAKNNFWNGFLECQTLTIHKYKSTQQDSGEEFERPKKTLKRTNSQVKKDNDDENGNSIVPCKKKTKKNKNQKKVAASMLLSNWN